MEMQHRDVGNHARVTRTAALVRVVSGMQCIIEILIQPFFVIKMVLVVLIVITGFDTGSGCGPPLYDGPEHSYCGTSFCGEE